MADERDERTEPSDDEDEGVLEQLREMPVGVNDPNIIGDAGPTDVPPGHEHPQPGEWQPDEEEPPES